MAYRDSSQIILRARDRLSDSDGTTFSDGEMLRHLDAVLVEFAGYHPYMKSSTITTVADQELYDLPSDCLWVTRTWEENSWTTIYEEWCLSYPYCLVSIEEYDLSRFRSQLKIRYQEYGQPLCVEWNNQLQVFPTPTTAGAIIHLEYAAAHVKDAAGNYTTVKFQDIQHIETLLVARCLEALANDAPKRSAYSEGQTRMDPGTMAADFRKRAADERNKVVSALSENLVGIG